jgi:predicted transcriptional regulator
MNEDVKKKREEYVGSLIKNFPDMKVHFINQLTKEIWRNDKTISELSKEEIEKINLIKQQPNEIILDIEEKYKLPQIKDKLKAKAWDYEIWDTGSRGFHISVKFRNLAQLDLELRDRIRKYIINEFETDDKMAKESQWMACPWSIHFKTGNYKLLVEDFIANNDNRISDEIIDYCKKDIENRKKSLIMSDEEFKDFYKTDPYLKYALTTKIVDGGRNDILFKNLAIGLVRSGLGEEDIIKIANKVVENCPGKSIGEFFGWVNRVKEGSLNEYNKSELVNWSLQYNHPVLYELVDDSEYLELLSAKQIWDIIWDNNISSQPIWKELAYYNMLSSLIDERDDDLRLHVIFSSFSSSGKDEGLNIIENILNRAGMCCFRPGEATDKTLVGGVNQFAIEYNTKNDLEEGETKKDKSWKNPTEEGILATAHWLAFGEAESVFKPGAHNQKIQLYLRQAMDKRRAIEKGVAGIFLKIYTNTTMCLTTYRMDDIINKILHNGLFQRALFYNKDVTEKEHRAIVEHITNHRFGGLKNKKYDEEKYIQVLVEKLKNIKIWYQENKHKIQEFKDCSTYTNYKWQELENRFAVLIKADKEIMMSMVRRSANTLYKLTRLISASNKSTEITNKNIDFCFDLICICLESIRILLLGVDKSKKMTNGILYLLLKEPLSRMNLYKLMSEMLEIKSTATQKKVVDNLFNAELITMDKVGRFELIHLTEKGRAQLGVEE